MTKPELRQKMMELRNNLSKEEQLRDGEEILQRLTGMELWSKSVQLFTYLSFGPEVDTWGPVKEAFSGEKGNPKEVFVPRVEGKRMNFYRITGTSVLKPSKFGVPEPDESHLIPYSVENKFKGSSTGVEFVQKSVNSAPKLMLVPGLAFDQNGNRIGYGAGYYDGFLKEYASDHFVKVALAYDFQVLEKIPTEEHDIRMDYIITPERIISCQSQLSYLLDECRLG